MVKGADAAAPPAGEAVLPSTSQDMQMEEEMEVSASLGSVSASAQMYDVASPEECGAAGISDSARIEAYVP